MTNAELQKRVERLEAENEALRSRTELGPIPVVAEADATVTARTPRAERAWGWTLLAVVLIVIGSLLAPVAVISSWAKTELTDTDNFVATFAPLAKNPDVQALITDQAVTAIDNQLDISKLTSTVIDGITSLGTGPRATAALEALKGPATQGIKTLVSNLISNFVKSDAFSEIWTQALRTSHRQMIATLENDKNAVVVSGPNGSVGIQLGPIIDQLKTVLVDRGLTFAAHIPTVNKTIVVAQSDSLAFAQAVYPLATAAGAWLPWIALLFLAAGVVVARRRALALIWASIALAVTMISLSAGYGIGRVFFLNAVSATVPSRAATVIYNQVVEGMQSTTLAITVLAIVVAIVGWLAGPFSVPRSLRGLASSAIGSLRAAAEKHGVTTGRVGEWFYAQRVVLRVLVALIGAAVVIFVRPLTPALIIWTLVLAVVVIGILELIQRPVILVPEDADEDTPVLIDQ